MAAAQTHFTAPRAQLPQVTASGPQKMATHGAASSPEQEPCTSKDTERTSSSGLSIHVSITRGDCTRVEKFKCFPHLSIPLLSEHHSTFPHFHFSAQLLSKYKLILSFVIWTEKCVSIVSAVGSPDHQSSAPLGCRRYPMGLHSPSSAAGVIWLHTCIAGSFPSGRAGNCIQHLWCSCQALGA